MRSGGNNFNYFKLTKLASSVQLKRRPMLMFFFWRIGGLGPVPSSLAPLQCYQYTVAKWSKWLHILNRNFLTENLPQEMHKNLSFWSRYRFT